VGRLCVTVATAAAATGLMAPASAPAAVIGADLPADADDTENCVEEGGCAFAQVKIAGDAVQAPVTGKIKSFKVQGASGNFGVQVLHKASGTDYKAVRSSSLAPADAAAGEVVKFSGLDMRIRKHESVALLMSGDSSFEINESMPTNFGVIGYTPPLATGDTGDPTFVDHEDLYLYNVKIKPS
jgi:hypothetical protein